MTGPSMQTIDGDDVMMVLVRRDPSNGSMWRVFWYNALTADMGEAGGCFSTLDEAESFGKRFAVQAGWQYVGEMAVISPRKDADLI